MSDDQLPETPPPATTPPAAAAQQPTANVLDAPEVRAAIAAAEERARNATWKQARETLGKKTGGTPSNATETTPAQPATSAPAVGMSPQDILRISAFTAAATDHGIPPKGVEMLLGEFMATKPADARAWVAEQAEAFGWRKPTPSTNTPTAPTAATVPPAQPTNTTPVTGTAAPTNPITVTADTPLISLPESVRLDMMKRDLIGYTDRFRAEAMASGARIRLR